MVFMCCPCLDCGNTRSYSDKKIFHTHLLYKGFMPHYNVWTKHGEIGVMMEDNEEEEDDDNYVTPEYGDAITGGAAGDHDEPDDVPDDAAMGEAAKDQEEPYDVPNDAARRKLLKIKRN